MGQEGGEKSVVVTQVSFGGFGSHVKAKELVDYLEGNIGLVWRCRLKTSWTPPDSYPDFDITETAKIERTDEHQKVLPHAFVHFALPDSADWAVAAAGRCELFFNGEPLRVSLGPENPYRLNERRRTTTPYKFSDVCVEIGTLVRRDDFFVGWRGPSSGVDFLVDPFDGTCKFCFSIDTAFSFKSSQQYAVIKCDFKVEFLVRDINEVKQYPDLSHLVLLFQLASPPLVWYRTANDDIEELVPFDLLDDDDPWIRTTDFTCDGAIGRCNTYRVCGPPHHGLKLNKAMSYLRERRVREECLRSPLKIRNEPDFGVPLSDPFFYIHYKEGIAFEIMFLVNAVVHKGIFNQHRLSDRFFDLLRSHNAHVVHANRSEYGALNENCILLVQLAATAVDFPTTGKLVNMPFHPKLKLYPDFMGKEEYQSYKSSKILGRLYRQIKDAYDEEFSSSSEVNFNPSEILHDTDLEVTGSVDFIADAWNQKCSYDGQLNGLLLQYTVNREEELVTGHIWSMPKYNSRKQVELKELLSDDEKNILYEHKASAWYQVTYHPEWVKKSLALRELDGTEQIVLLSFAWIAADYLARLKIRGQGMEIVNSGKPVNSLVKYLADRMNVTSI